MADKSKGPVIVLIFLLLVAIAAAALCFRELQKEKQTSARLLSEKEQLEKSEKSNKKEIARLNESIEGLKIQRDEQQAKVQEYERKIAAFKDELEIEKKAKEDALSAIEKSKEELSSLKASKAKAEAELKVAKDTLHSVQEQLAAIEKAKESSLQKPKEEAKQESKPQDVQLEKIVVASSGSSRAATAASPQIQSAPEQASTQTPVEGKVLVVNKEYDFVVVSIGQKDNIAVSDALEVFRNNKKLGEMKVEEVRDTMSVATPNNKDIIRQIKEDDRVVRKI